MNFIDRIRFALAPTALKAAALLPVIAPWVRATFYDEDWHTFNHSAYKLNSAVFACVSALSFAFIEPPLKIYRAADKEELPKHPTRQLVIKPNDIMGEGELWLHTIIYAAIGGNAYWHKVRNGQRKVIGLKPYHIGNIAPVPGRSESWVDGYEYDNGTGEKTPVPKEDIVHFKWPSVDLSQPWIAMPPLLPALREVATDNEAVRYLKAILQNDAVPRMVMYVPGDSDLDLDSEEKQARLKAQFRAKYGGDNRGDLAIVTGGAKMERISLNLQELSFDAIHRIPESRITAAMRVPAIIAGLNAGLENSTYSNYGEAKEQFTRGTLGPLWNLFASEVASDPDLNPDGDIIAFEMSEVQALQEDTNARWERLTAALNAGAITINDFLRGVGHETTLAGDVRLIPTDRILVKMDAAEIEIVEQTQSTQAQGQTDNTDPAQVDPTDPTDGKGRKQLTEGDGGHVGTLVNLACPICGNVGVNVFDDHKGLAVCPACTCTFDPALEVAEIGKNGRH